MKKFLKNLNQKCDEFFETIYRDYFTLALLATALFDIMVFGSIIIVLLKIIN